MKKFLFLFLLNSFFNYSQEFNLYVQKYRYERLFFNTSIKNYYIFTDYHIDQHNEQIIDLNRLELSINKKIPDISSTDLIILDLENDIFKSLKDNYNTKNIYDENIDKMINMVDFVKKLRPHSKVSIYGLPFNFLNEKQKKNNNFNKLKPLLIKLDYLCPSLYLYDLDSTKNAKYLNENLSFFLKYSAKLNKQIIPFVWYRIHPSNPNYGREIIDSVSFAKYINYIKNYKYNGSRVSGLIYWEPHKSNINVNKQLLETINILKL